MFTHGRHIVALKYLNTGDISRHPEVYNTPQIYVSGIQTLVDDDWYED